MAQDRNSAHTGAADDDGVGEPGSGGSTAALDGLKQRAQTIGQQAKERATEYAESYAEGGKQTVTEHLDTFAQAIRRASDELSQKDQTLAAQMVRQAAGGLESLSRSVNNASFGDMVDSIRDFGRRNPAAFIGGAVLIGLALGRFARASGRPTGGGEWDYAGRADDGSSDTEWRRNRGQTGGGYGAYPAGSRAFPSTGQSGSQFGGQASGRGYGDAGSAGRSFAGSGSENRQPSSATEASVGESSHAGGGASSGTISTGAGR